MKKRFVKLLSAVLAFAFIVPAFALAGCTDKEEKPRTLDTVELSIVGDWDSGFNIWTFKSDGTCSLSNGNTDGFRHIGDGTHDERHYEIIQFEGGSLKYALYDDDQNHMYNIYDGTPSDNPYFTRI